MASPATGDNPPKDTVPSHRKHCTQTLFLTRVALGFNDLIQPMNFIGHFFRMFLFRLLTSFLLLGQLKTDRKTLFIDLLCNLCLGILSSL